MTIFFYHRTEAARANRINIRQKSQTRMFCSLLFYITLYCKVYRHAIDNFKLCWESSEKKVRVKKHRSASKPLHNCSNHCNVSFFNNDHAYMYLYFCIKWWLQLFCSQLQILPATTAPLIVDKSNVAKGLASRFLWIFLKPVFKPFLAMEVRGYLRQYPVLNSVMKKLYATTFHQILFSYIKIQPKLDPQNTI